MGDDVRSMLLAPAGLYLPLAAALVLSFVRSSRSDAAGDRAKLARFVLVGIACQGAHFLEELVTELPARFPPLFGLAPISTMAFAGFNIFWLVVWVVAALGLPSGSRLAYFPIWFFGLGMCLNGVAHPLLSIWVGGYFPGLITSPIAGVVGVVVVTRLLGVTEWGGE